MADDTLSAISQLFGSGGLGSSPGSDIINFQKTVAANDPWNMAAAPVLSTKLNTSTWTPNQALAGSLVQAFLGSALKAIGTHDEGDQLASLAAVMPQLSKDPSSVALPDGMDPAAFNAFKLSQMSKQEATNEAARKTLLEKGVQLNSDGSFSNPTGAIQALLAVKEAEAKGNMQGQLEGQSQAVQNIMANNPDTQLTAEQIAMLPKEMRKQVQAKQDSANALTNTLSTVNDAFDKMKGVSTLQAVAEPWSPEYTQFHTAQGDIAAAIQNLAKTTRIPAGLLAPILSNIPGDFSTVGNIEATRANMINELTKLNSKVDPGSLGTSAGSGIDAAALHSEAASLAAQGYTQDQISQTLRDKYGG